MGITVPFSHTGKRAQVWEAFHHLVLKFTVFRKNLYDGRHSLKCRAKGSDLQLFRAHFQSYCQLSQPAISCQGQLSGDLPGAHYSYTSSSESCPNYCLVVSLIISLRKRGLVLCNLETTQVYYRRKFETCYAKTSAKSWSWKSDPTPVFTSRISKRSSPIPSMRFKKSWLPVTPTDLWGRGFIHSGFFFITLNFSRTNMNEHSSRSHAIFIITVECAETGPDGESHIR